MCRDAGTKKQGPHLSGPCFNGDLRNDTVIRSICPNHAARAQIP